MDDFKFDPIGSDWESVRKEIFTQDEISECDLRVALVSETIANLPDVPDGSSYPSCRSNL